MLLDVREMQPMYDQALLVDDPLFDQHRASGTHPERPERLIAARRAVEAARKGIQFQDLPARDALDDELRRVHTEAYLGELGRSAGHWGELDPDTYLSPGSWAAARRAAGAAVTLTQALAQGASRWGIALVRPPGHHARPGAAMGFCLLNNVAVAAAHARALGTQRVLVLDWDVHHGNGTQEIFYSDPSVLYASVHQAPYYPGTGAASEVGRGDGRGYTVNVPLSAGAGDSDYLAAFERVLCPIVEAYQPELVLVSAGFDAHARDPLGGMMLSDRGYSELARALCSALTPACPVGLVLEGGYDLTSLQGSLEKTFEGLRGGPPPPAGPSPSTLHAQEIELARSELCEFWSLP